MGDGLTRFGQGLARQPRREEIAYLHQHVAAHPQRQIEQAVFHLPARTPAPPAARPGERHEFDMAQRFFGRRRHHQPDAGRQPAEHAGGIGQHAFERAPRDLALHLDIGAIVVAQVVLFQQAFDEQLQPGFCRQPPGRGMGA